MNLRYCHIFVFLWMFWTPFRLWVKEDKMWQYRKRIFWERPAAETSIIEQNKQIIYVTTFPMEFIHGKIFQTSATNFFHCFSVSFYLFCTRSWIIPNTLITRSFLAQSAHKSNHIYNKIQNIWFPSPTYSVLQLPKQCLLRMWCCLTFVCVYIF